MPVLPHRSLKKYSSLPPDSPSTEQDVSRPKLYHSTSAPAGGNRLVSVFHNIRHKLSSSEHPDRQTDLTDSYDSDSSRATSSPRRSPDPEDSLDRPHLSPYFRHKKRTDVNGSTEEERKRFELDATEEPSDGKRPTLNPIFKANHHFIKALRKMGSRDNFSRLKPGRDD